jgi:hypothetical protein
MWPSTASSFAWKTRKGAPTSRRCAAACTKHSVARPGHPGGSFRGGQASAPGPFGARIKVPVKDIELKGVGEDKGGLTPIELADFLLDLMDPGLGNAVRNTDVGAMVKGLFK